MKTKSTIKPKHTAKSAPARETTPTALSPAQFILSQFPGAESSPAARAALAAMFSGSGIDFGVTVPEWAKQTAKLYYTLRQWTQFQKPLTNLSPNEAGKFVGSWEISPKAENERPEVTMMIDAYCKAMRQAATDATPDDCIAFHKGRKAAQEMADKAKDPSERTTALYAIMMNWPEIEKLGSRMKTYKWLKDKRLISPGTDWDEVKDWLAEINLPKGKAGAPRKIGGSTKSKNPVFPKKSESGL